MLIVKETENLSDKSFKNLYIALLKPPKVRIPKQRIPPMEGKYGNMWFGGGPQWTHCDMPKGSIIAENA